MSLKYNGELIYFGVGAVLLILFGSSCNLMKGAFPSPLNNREPAAAHDKPVVTASEDTPRLNGKSVATASNGASRPTAEEEKVVAMMEAAASRANDAAVRANAAAKKPEAAATKAEMAAKMAAAAAKEAKIAAAEAQTALKKAFLILMSVGR
jgi:hypothetical protein